MSADILIQNLDVKLTNHFGPISIEADQLKAILDYVKRLELTAADALRLAHANSKNVPKYRKAI